MKRILLLSMYIVSVLALSGSVHAQSTDDLKRMLDEAARTTQDLKNRVDALERDKQAAAQAPSKPPVAAAGAPMVAPGSTAEEGAPNADKARVEFFGQVMLDSIYDIKRVDPDWNATLRPSKIPVNCPGDAGCGKDGETIFSVRQTKFGFRGFIPTTEGELTTLLDFDMFDSGGGTTHGRLLHAWGEVGWFGAGQTETLFMDADVFPNTLDYWGPNGMVYVRNPQVRITPYKRDGLKLAFSLEAPSAAIDTGKISEVDPVLGANVTGNNRYPDAVASLRLDRDWGHFQAAGLLRQVGYETPSNPGSSPSGDKTGYGLNLSGVYNTIGRDRVMGQFVYGRAIASYMNDGGVDLAPDENLQAEAVKSVGWLAYYDHYWNDKWSSSVGYSEHRQINSGGQLADAFRKGSYASVNLLYYPLKNLTTGAELLWGELENKNGDSHDDQRIQFSAKYTF